VSSVCAANDTGASTISTHKNPKYLSTV